MRAIETLSPVLRQGLGLGLGLGGLGRGRGFLCRNRVLLVMCLNRMWSRPGGLVSRHKNCVVTGWRDGRALVCAIDEFFRDREFSFTTEIVRPCVAIGHGAAEVRGDKAPWTSDRVRDRVHDARD